MPSACIFASSYSRISNVREMICMAEYPIPSVCAVKLCRREAWLKLQIKLAAADRQMAEGMMLDHSDVMARLKARIKNLREAPT